MAKKDPKEMTVEDKLLHLYQLQTTLSAIDEKKAMRGELPLEVQDLEDEIAGLTTRMENIQGEIDELDRKVSEKRGKIGECNISLERLNKQLENVSNNREYDALTKTIENLGLDVELFNKDIRTAYIEMEGKRKAMDECRELIEERRKDLVLKRSELEEIMQETREEEERLKEKARDIEVKIEPRLLASFKRIRKNARNGLGIVYVERDACGGCFNKIPPQRQLDIKMHKKIIVCEYCGRIMIDPELAGVKTTAAVEEKPKRKRAVRRTKKETPVDPVPEASETGEE